MTAVRTSKTPFRDRDVREISTRDGLFPWTIQCRGKKSLHLRMYDGVPLEWTSAVTLAIFESEDFLHVQVKVFARDSMGESLGKILQAVGKNERIEEFSLSDESGLLEKDTFSRMALLELLRHHPRIWRVNLRIPYLTVQFARQIVAALSVHSVVTCGEFDFKRICTNFNVYEFDFGVLARFETLHEGTKLSLSRCLL